MLFCFEINISLCHIHAFIRRLHKHKFHKLLTVPKKIADEEEVYIYYYFWSLQKKQFCVGTYVKNVCEVEQMILFLFLRGKTEKNISYIVLTIDPKCKRGLIFHKKNLKYDELSLLKENDNHLLLETTNWRELGFRLFIDFENIKVDIDAVNQ